MKTKTKKPARKINANTRALLIAYINAVLADLDGKLPRRVRLDHHTLELYQIVPLTTLNDFSLIKIMDVLKPMLKGLKQNS
jgi:hypothetical protein